MKQTAVFEDVFPSVPFHEAEIEDFFGFERANSAGAGAEAVDEPGKLEKRGEFKNLQAAGLAKAPGRGNARHRRRRGRRLTRPATLQ